MKQSILLLLFCLPFYVFSQSAGKFVLLEEFSTAPCGFCPDGDVIADELVKKNPNIIWVTHHAGFGTDSMTVPESITIANAFTTFAPGAAIDRGDYQIPVYTMAPYIAVSRQKWDSVCTSHFNDPQGVYIGISNNYNAATRLFSCTVDATFLTTPAPGDMRINLYLVEDSVVGSGSGYDQKNYLNTQAGHPCYQKGDPYIGYVHHRVIRKIPTGAWGVSGIIPSSPVAGTKYSKTYSNISIPTNWRTGKMDVVAFVSYHNTSASLRKVINANHKSLLDASASGIAQSGSAGTAVVYPNPASGRIQVKGDFGTGNRGTLIISNTTGQALLHFTLNGNNPEFSINDLAPGLYFYAVTENGIQHSAGRLCVVK